MSIRMRTLLLGAFTAVASTLVVNPWFAYDPINLPKMLVLSLGASIMGCLILFNLRQVLLLNKWFLGLFGLLFLFLITSIFVNDPPINQQIFGVWGRSTGLITYCSFIIVSIFLAIFADEFVISSFRLHFERLSYFISFYTVIQWAELDPINWSQKIMIATLGNINFMSSFLGIAGCSFLVRVFVENKPVSSKLFFIFMIAINIWLIIVSGSIQGLAILAVGISFIILLQVKRRLGLLSASFASISLALSGLIVFLGSAGIGPLAMLRQDTVLFRLDYWKAGLRMTFSNPFFGVGVDSYGDYYRQYRDTEAILRTGPQRVTNTAHNIFLDVSSGSGVIAGLSLFFIVIAIIIISTRKILTEVVNTDFIAWTLMLMGFFVFCLISINQIGVGVWGFVAIGLLLSVVGRKKVHLEISSPLNKKKRLAKHVHKQKSEDLLKTNSTYSGKLLPLIKTLVVVLSCGSLVSMTFSANVADARFLAAIKSNELEKALEISTEFVASDFHREVLVTRFENLGRKDESLKLAWEVVGNNPRNWTSWVAIFSNENSSVAERAEAARRLIALDPNNEAIRK